MDSRQKLTTQELEGLRCSFCGKPKSEVLKLVIASSDAPDIAICDECFVYVAEIMTGETPTVIA